MDASMPAISVVVFSYNFGKYLDQCLASLVAQTLRPYEIIVCDDCSTDNSWQIVTDYKERYPDLFKIFRHEKNIGHIENGVFGKEQVTGELISVIDGDDWWHPEKLEMEVAALQRDPEAKAAYSGVILVDENGRELGRWIHENHERLASDDVFLKTFAKRLFSGTRSLFRNQLLYTDVLRETTIQNPNEKIIHADWYWKTNVAAKYKIVFSGKDLVMYRQHTQGISRQKSTSLYESAKYVIAKNLPLLRNRTQPEVNFVLEGLNSLSAKLAMAAGLNGATTYNIKHVFPPRILVNSVPKSGTNMVTRLLGMLPGLAEMNIHLGHSTTSSLNGPTSINEAARAIPVGVDMPKTVALEHVTRAIDSLFDGSFLSCHIPWSEALDAYIRDKDFKMVLVLRDPRDVVVSHARYIAETKSHPFHAMYSQRSKEEQIWTSINGASYRETTLLSIGDRLKSMAGWMDHPNVLMVRFEDLVGPRGGGDAGVQEAAIHRIADFLNVPLGSFHSEEISDNLFGKSKTFRKGQIASWKHVLNDDQVKGIESMQGVELSRFGYATSTVEVDTNQPVSGKESVKKGGRNLIFLVSQPRSGSTLMQRVLGGHPDIYTLAEPWIMLHPLYALKKQGMQAEYDAGLARNGLEDFIDALPRGREEYLDGIRQMAATWYNKAMASSGKRLFLDKTPRYYYIIPELGETFPDSKIILLFRNPLSVLSSVLKTWVGKNWARLQLHRDDILRGPALMVQGMEALGQKAIVLRYEDFVRASEARLKHLCTSLEIEFGPEMLNYGATPPPQGRMGDSVGIHKHSCPTPASLDKWKETFTDPTYHLLAEIMLTLVGEEVVAKMGYNFKQMWQDLQNITPVSRSIPQNELANLVAALHLSKERIAQISHLFVPYLKQDLQPARVA